MLVKIKENSGITMKIDKTQLGSLLEMFGTVLRKIDWMKDDLDKTHNKDISDIFIKLNSLHHSIRDMHDSRIHHLEKENEILLQVLCKEYKDGTFFAITPDMDPFLIKN